MSIVAPRTPYEEAFQEWIMGGAQRGEPRPREEDYPEKWPDEPPYGPVDESKEIRSAGNPFGSEEGRQAPTDVAQNAMIERDKAAWLDNLRTHASGFKDSGEGSNWEEVAKDELEGAIRKMQYSANAGTDPQRWLDEAKARITRRIQADDTGGDTGDNDGRGNQSGTSRGNQSGNMGQMLGPNRNREGYTQAPTGSLGRPTSIIGDFEGTRPEVPQVDPYGPTAPYAAPDPYTASTYAAPDPYGAREYTAPTYTSPVPFTAPTAADMAADPGYQFRLQQGQQALERSGAARGVTRTGGTLKDVLDYGQRAASQEYGNVFNRMASQYGMNEGLRGEAFDRNAGNAWNAWTGNEAGRARAYDVNAANAWNTWAGNEAGRSRAYDVNEANRLAAERQTQQGRTTGYQIGANQQQQDYQNQYNNWVQSYNQWRQQGQDRFGEQYSLARS
jgi:hypothetical protein